MAAQRRRRLAVARRVAVAWWVGSLLVAAGASALDPGRRLTQYSRRMWQDELPQSSVHTILQSRDGYLWFGTYEGLVRFDGVRFVVFDADHTGDLAGGTVQHLREDDDGRLWISTNAGLSVLENGAFSSRTAADGLPSSFVTATAAAADGAVWVATGAGLARVSGRTVALQELPGAPAGAPVRTAVVDAGGALWAATDHGLYRVAGAETQRFGTAEGLPDESIRALAAGPGGELWVGTNNGLARWTGSAFVAIRSSEGLPSDAIRALLLDRRGTLWIGTEDRGLLRREATGAFVALGTAQGLSHDYVRSLAEDREGGLWVGTNGGLNQLRDAKFTAYSTLEGLGNDYVRTIFEDRDGRLWVGSDGGGLELLTERVTRRLTTADGLANSSVRSIEQTADGALWIGTRGGVSRITGGRIETLDAAQGLSSPLVRVVYEDIRGRVWVGTEDGLNLWHGDRFEVFTTADGLAGNDVRALFDDSEGRLWIGTFSGVSRLEDGRFTSFTTADGLSSDIVFTFFEDQWGELWIGTDSGLNLFRDGRFSSFGTGIGLFDNKVFCFLDDGHGSLWMSSNRGVSRVTLASLHAVAEGRLDALEAEVFGTADGMKTNQCNGASQPAGCRARDGTLWFPTPRGAVAVDPAELRRNPLPPPLAIEEVLVDGELQTSAPSLRLPPGRRSLEIHYTALSFQAPENVLFRYRLRGYEREMVDAGTRRTAYFTNLSPGRYRFEVVACNDDGVWNDTPATLAIELVPHWWQRWWAWLGYAAVATCLLWALVRLRLSALARRAARLEAMVAERTAELDERNADLAEKLRQLEISERNALLSERRALEASRAKSIFLSNMSHELRTPLNSIIGFSTILAKKLPGAVDGRTLKFVHNIRGSGEHLLGLINDLLDLTKIEAGRMELNIERFELAPVLDESQRVMQGVSHRKGITVTTEVAAGLPPLTGDRAKLKQVLFNLLSNAVKFSPGGSEVRVVAQSLDRAGSPLGVPSLQLEVIDHGVGIARQHQEIIFEEFRQVDGSASRQHEGTGLGLALVKRIVELQGGVVRVRSELGKGSTFTVHLPLEVAHGPDADAEPPAVLWSERGGPGLAAAAPATILVVEDEPTAYHQLASTLEAAGYRVVGARDGEEALKRVATEAPALITLDLVLPGLDGWELLRELKSDARTDRIPVVIVTRKDSRELCLALGADDFFLKPVDGEVLLERARAIVAPGSGAAVERRRVLVIDDDPAVRELLSYHLGEAGFVVSTAADGPTGLELASRERPELVVLDLLMPGMSGFEVARRLRAEAVSAGLPIIVLTAKELSPEERVELAGMIQALITKGADSTPRLVATIRDLLARR